MFTITRSLTVLLAVVLLVLGLIGASAAPSTAAPPQQPYLWPETIISDFDSAEGYPEITYNRKHNEYFVVWQTTIAGKTDKVRGARISATGQVLANFEINGHPTKDSFRPAVAYDPLHDRYLVVFVFDVSGSDTNTDLIGRFIPWEGPDPAQKSFPISTWPTFQLTPDVTYGRAVDEFLVVWVNVDPAGKTPRYISGRRIRAANGSFPGSDSDLTLAHPLKGRVNPVVTYNLARNEYLVVYDNYVDILGTRFTGEINHDFGGEFAIAGWSDQEDYPSVAACHKADQYLVTWQSEQGSGNLAIYGRFISGSGQLGSVHEIDDTTGHERQPSVSCSSAGTQYLVAWQTEYTNLKYGVWARFVQPDGQMGSQFAVQHPHSQSHRTRPAVAGARNSFMSVWEHERGNTTIWDVHGRLVSPYAIFAPAQFAKTK